MLVVMIVLEFQPRQHSEKMASEIQRILIKEVADIVGISIRESNFLLCIEKLLLFEQMQRRISIAQELLNIVNDDPDLSKNVVI